LAWPAAPDLLLGAKDLIVLPAGVHHRKCAIRIQAANGPANPRKAASKENSMLSIWCLRIGSRHCKQEPAGSGIRPIGRMGCAPGSLAGAKDLIAFAARVYLVYSGCRGF
jgi:hypothetical protein